MILSGYSHVIKLLIEIGLGGSYENRDLKKMSRSPMSRHSMYRTQGTKAREIAGPR